MGLDLDFEKSINLKSNVSNFVIYFERQIQLIEHLLLMFLPIHAQNLFYFFLFQFDLYTNNEQEDVHCLEVLRMISPDRLFLPME